MEKELPFNGVLWMMKEHNQKEKKNQLEIKRIRVKSGAGQMLMASSKRSLRTFRLNRDVAHDASKCPHLF